MWPCTQQSQTHHNTEQIDRPNGLGRWGGKGHWSTLPPESTNKGSCGGITQLRVAKQEQSCLSNSDIQSQGHRKIQGDGEPAGTQVRLKCLLKLCTFKHLWPNQYSKCGLGIACNELAHACPVLQGPPLYSLSRRRPCQVIGDLALSTATLGSTNLDKAEMREMFTCKQCRLKDHSHHHNNPKLQSRKWVKASVFNGEARNRKSAQPLAMLRCSLVSLTHLIIVMWLLEKGHRS